MNKPQILGWALSTKFNNERFQKIVGMSYPTETGYMALLMRVMNWERGGNASTAGVSLLPPS